MIHESNKVNNLVIVKSNLNFQEIYSKPYFPKALEEDLKKANLLLLPNENFRSDIGPVFPEQTMEFYQFMKNFESNGLIGDICISDEDYTELELHADLATIAHIIVEQVALPLAVNLVSNYLAQKFLVPNDKEEAKIKVDITSVDGEKSEHISYEGDARKFAETLDSIKKRDI